MEDVNFLEWHSVRPKHITFISRIAKWEYLSCNRAQWNIIMGIPLVLETSSSTASRSFNEGDADNTPLTWKSSSRTSTMA
ncbi:hypothetical protein RSAG8_04999, partial [Rhizoctonia solani AG-8 WAC10335]